MKNKKITNFTLKRTIRTFFQAFLGAFITAGTGIMWNEVDIKSAIVGILMTSLFAGLSAMLMNLEDKEVK